MLAMKYKGSAVCLRCRKPNAPARIQDRRSVMEQQHPLPSPAPRARTPHPTASLHPQPSLSLSFTSPTSQIQLNSALPFACPPSPMIQKVSFEIQGSGGRNVAGSGVREAERGGISPLQPFASTNQQPQSSCQARGCWA